MSTFDSLTMKVEEALMNDSRTQDAGIDVSSNQGVVTLSGWVDSAEVTWMAEEIASRQEGVIKVINSLLVKANA